MRYRYIRKTGGIVWTSINARAIRDAAGRISHFEGTAENITARKQTENDLRTNEALFSTALKLAHLGYWEYNVADDLFAFNDHIYALLHTNAEREGGYTMSSDQYAQRFVYPEDASIVANETQKAIETTDPNFSHEVEHRIMFSDGGIGYISVRFFVVKDNQGRTVKTYGVNQDITERKRAEEGLKETTEKLRKGLIGTIQALSSTVETRDPYTAGHQRRVSNLARTIAQEMGLSNDTVDTIRMAGALHDLGKIAVPSEILSKPGKITDVEMSLIKVHSQAGYDILKDVELPYPLAEIVLQHHERLDGSGYPQGLKGDQIFLETQIISVSDVVEAIASHRPYRPALGIQIALQEIEKNKDILYDKVVVDTCLRLFREKGFRFE